METTDFYSNNSVQIEPQTIIVKQNNGIGIAGLIMAVLGLLFCWVPFLKWILIIPAVLLSLIGSFRRPRLLALIGLGISLVTTIVVVSLNVSMVNSVLSLAYEI